MKCNLQFVRIRSLLMIAIFSVGCSRERTISSATSSDLNKEAQEVADHIKELLWTKCGDYYYSYDYPGRAYKSIVAKAEKTEFIEAVQYRKQFLGYQWNGRVRFSSDSGPLSCCENEIYKRGSTWYFSSAFESAVEVSLLRSAKPSCPSAP